MCSPGFPAASGRRLPRLRLPLAPHTSSSRSSCFCLPRKVRSRDSVLAPFSMKEREVGWGGLGQDPAARSCSSGLRPYPLLAHPASSQKCPHFRSEDLTHTAFLSPPLQHWLCNFSGKSRFWGIIESHILHLTLRDSQFTFGGLCDQPHAVFCVFFFKC